MLDIREILLSANQKTQKREERFSLVGEMDGKGNIIFHKHYLYNPGKKTKPIKISAKDFWGADNQEIIELHKATALKNKKIKKSCLKESHSKVKRLQNLAKKGNSSNSKKTKKIK